MIFFSLVEDHNGNITLNMMNNLMNPGVIHSRIFQVLLQRFATQQIFKLNWSCQHICNTDTLTSYF